MLNSMVMPLFLCRPEILIFGKFGLESQNCLFKLKFGTGSNSNMLNSTANFTAYCFRPEIPFLANFNSKTENCLHKMKFCNLTNARMIFIFLPGKLCLGRFRQKNQSLLFKPIFGTKTDLLIFLVKFTFPVL